MKILLFNLGYWASVVSLIIIAIACAILLFNKAKDYRKKFNAPCYKTLTDEEINLILLGRHKDNEYLN